MRGWVRLQRREAFGIDACGDSTVSRASTYGTLFIGQTAVFIHPACTQRPRGWHISLCNRLPQRDFFCLP
jgi:hypothetical protein